jgi:hypothetical protein
LLVGSGRKCHKDHPAAAKFAKQADARRAH